MFNLKSIYCWVLFLKRGNDIEPLTDSELKQFGLK